MVLLQEKTWVLEIGRGVPPIESLRLRKLSLEARFQTRMQLQQAGAARRISVRFAEAAALPCVQNMRGASIIILSLMLSLIRFRRAGGSAGELKVDSERLPKTGKQRFARRE